MCTRPYSSDQSSTSCFTGSTLIPDMVYVPTELFLGDGVLPLPQKIMKKRTRIHQDEKAAPGRATGICGRQRIPSSIVAAIVPIARGSPLPLTSSHGYRDTHPLWRHWLLLTGQRTLSLSGSDKRHMIAEKH